MMYTIAVLYIIYTGVCDMFLREKNFWQGICISSVDCVDSFDNCSGRVDFSPSTAATPVVPSGFNVTVSQEISLTPGCCIPTPDLTFSVSGSIPVSSWLATVKSVLPESQYCRILPRYELDWQVINDCGLPSFTVCIQASPAGRNIPRTPRSYRHIRKNRCRIQVAAERKGFLRL